MQPENRRIPRANWGLTGALLALLVGATLVSLFTGHSGPAARPALPTAPHGPQELRWSLEGITELSTLDPAEVNNQAAVTAMSLIYSSLVKLNERLIVVGDGAQRWEVSADGLVYTFHLQPKLTFADGTRVTAADYAYSINRALSPAHAKGNAYFHLNHILGSKAVRDGTSKAARGIMVLDKSTLQITIDRPITFFLYTLTYPVAMAIPKALIRRYGNNHWTNHAAASGPFRVKTWNHAQHKLILIPNLHYYGGTLNIRQITLSFYADAKDAYQDYRRGKLDIMGSISFPSNAFRQVQGASFAKQIPKLTVEYLNFNTRQAPFDKPLVRRAFAAAVDKESLARQTLGGEVAPTDLILPPGMPGYRPLPVSTAFDPVAARAYLSEAGFPGGRGLPAITYTYQPGEDDRMRAQALQHMWSVNLGVQVRLKQITDGAVYDKLLNERAFQLAIITWSADYPDPQDFLSLLLHSGVGNNNGGWSNPAFDQLVDEADETPDSVLRQDIYNEAQQIALYDAPWIPLDNTIGTVLLSPQISGLTVNGIGVSVPDWTRVQVSR